VIRGGFNVVEADDGDIVRYQKVCVAQSADCSDGCDVVKEMSAVKRRLSWRSC